MERYLNLSLPFGLAPTEATIGSYRQKPSARALHRVYSVEATFGSEKRCFHRYETGGEPWPVSAASSHQLSPHWHKASGSESKEKMLHSVATLTCMSSVQLFVYVSETQLDIEFTIKKPIKTQCKTPHPQPLSPSTGRGEQDQKMWLAACATR